MSSRAFAFVSGVAFLFFKIRLSCVSIARCSLYCVSTNLLNSISSSSEISDSFSFTIPISARIDKYSPFDLMNICISSGDAEDESVVYKSLSIFLLSTNF